MYSSSKAMENFMKSTGFGKDTSPPPPAPAYKPPQSQQAFQQFHSMGAPKPPAQMIPGQARPNPTNNRGDQIVGGLIPGHAPTRGNASNPSVYPASNRVGNVPYNKGPSPSLRSAGDDWNTAVGIGEETRKTSPGKLATSPKDQGKFYEIKEKLAGMSKANLYDVAMVFFGICGLIAAGVAGNSLRANHGFDKYIAAGAVACFGIAAAIYQWRPDAKEEHAKGNVWPSNGSQDVRDTNSGPQPIRPQGIVDSDPNPYPKPMDISQTWEQRMQAQGTDPNALEGPRPGYRYKRGPTPANQRRLRDSDLMRSAQMHNMDEYELNEYLARLEGEAPDQFYQVQPYHPFGAQWDNRVQIDDSERIHGISDQPSQVMRYAKYRDPKMQQAGAKTMHYKDPPPGSVQPLNRVHPWMERREAPGPAMDMDSYAAEHLMADHKVGNDDVARLVRERAQMDDLFNPPMRPQSDKLPPELEPIPTSREGMQALMKKKMEERQRAQGGPAYGQPSGMQGMQAPPPPQAPAEAAESEFAAAFTPKRQPTDSEVNAELATAGRR